MFSLANVPLPTFSSGNLFMADSSVYGTSIPRPNMSLGHRDSQNCNKSK